MSLSIQKVHSFIVVAQYGSFVRAAEELHVSQPALTRHIQDLEEHLGVPLLSRTTRSVRLTPAGEVFRNRMSRLLAEMNRVVRDVQEEASFERGHIAVACVPTIANTVLPAILSSYARKYPQISVHVMDEMSESLERRILSHEADFGIGPAPRRSGHLDFAFIIRDHFVVIFAKGHPLAGRREVDIEDLTEFDFVAISHGNVRTAVDDALREIGIQIVPKYEALSPQTLGRMIDKGLGIGILPSMTIPATGESGLLTARLRTPRIVRDIGLLRRRGWVPGPAAASFIDEVRKFMPRAQPS